MSAATLPLFPLDQFADPDALVCPVCLDDVRCEPPGYWLVRDGLPAPEFSHLDATALCRDGFGLVSEPVELRPLQ